MSDVVTVASTSIREVTPVELDEFTRRLPVGERERAATMRIETQRRSFVFGRLLLRAVVARVAGATPDDVGIEIDEAGRPVVVGALSRFSASIAHSGDYVVVGVALLAVGVDVEVLPSSPHLPGLVARVCSPGELSQLERMTDAERQRAFMTVWTRKEAYGKALGVGLDFDLRAVTVGAAGSRISGGDGDWWVCDLTIDTGYAAAVVAQGSGWRVQLATVDHRSL
jgi:4'-phosphopantetheinyl transferase